MFRSVRLSVLLASFISAAILSTLCSNSLAGSFKTRLPLPNRDSLPVYVFLPDQGVKHPVPGVVVGVGVGGQKILQYHDYCQCLANRNFVVVLMDPANYPEVLIPGPFSWDKGIGYMIGSVNQGVVAARLFCDIDWYMESIKAGVDYLCCSPIVDPYRIAISGFSQPANAALTYACRDPRIKAVVWNYGGEPWVMPYDPLKLPPVQIFHGDRDEVYSVKYARELALNLQSHMRCYEVNIYPGQKHMFNIYYDIRRETRYNKPVLLEAFERLVSFLCRTLARPCR